MLAQGVVETLDMICGTTLIGGVVLLGRKDVVITFQVIGMDAYGLVGKGNPTPKQLGGPRHFRGRAHRRQSARYGGIRRHTQTTPSGDASQSSTMHHFQDLLRLGWAQGGLQRR